MTPESGKGSDSPQRVTVTVLNNAGYNRSKQLKFNIGFDYKTIAFTQAGERGEEVIGTVDNPFSVAGAIKYLKTLGPDVNSPKKVFVKGKISRIDNEGLFGQSSTSGLRMNSSEAVRQFRLNSRKMWMII